MCKKSVYVWITAFAILMIGTSGCGWWDSDSDVTAPTSKIGPGLAVSQSFGPNTVHADDVDGDGDTDVLSASGAFGIAWHENTDGDGSGWTDHLIDGDNGSGRCVVSADIDGDGDIDVISALFSTNTVAWHENTEGDGSAWFTYLINEDAGGIRSVFAADLDGDGDIDVISGSPNDNTVAWYENTAGNGSEWTKRIITDSASGIYSTFAADIDGDGDMDVVSGWGEDTVAWHENTAGDGSVWTTHDITDLAGASVDFVEKVYVADLDGDGDMDVLSASYHDDKIAWYENVLGDGSAWNGYVISIDADGAFSVAAGDLDTDGDMDVISGSELDGKATWYENIDGEGTFEERAPLLINVDGDVSVYAADLDGDKDPDVIASTYEDVTVWWFESLGVPADGGGSSGDCENIAGTWTLVVTDIDSTCGPEPGWESTVTITQDGCTLETSGIKETPFNVPGTVDGNAVTIGPADFQDGEGITTSTFNMTLESGGTSMSGTETWTWASATDSCSNGTANVTATKSP